MPPYLHGAAGGVHDVRGLRVDGGNARGQPAPQRGRLRGGADDGRLRDAAPAQRAGVEITQAKGTSETHPVLSPNDEFANFELFPELLTTNRPIGGDAPNPGAVRVDGLVPASYAREALVNGVRMQAEREFNPFQFGFVGTTDFHSGTSALEENPLQRSRQAYDAGSERGDAEHRAAGHGRIPRS